LGRDELEQAKHQNGTAERDRHEDKNSIIAPPSSVHVNIW